MEVEEDAGKDEMGDTIMCEEFDREMKDLSRNKVPGEDNFPLELLIALGEPARQSSTIICKILTRILYRRMEKLVEAYLGENWFGFCRNVRLILEERLREGKPTFLAFVDLEKAFDNFKFNTLFQVLKVEWGHIQGAKGYLQFVQK
ncbi:uncharacterized protein LOC126209946 [Schistocerca nitens]|uniref:uncharacterized protein LOC126209946 n=1 Tax=Schistocerca nitens TaxID=7011 RepID=UPI00211874ED|nr:uncharacterized protein LOC126209946 [Schistocerca nitens]